MPHCLRSYSYPWVLQYSNSVQCAWSFGRQEMNKSASELPPFFVVDDELPLAELPRLYPLLTPQRCGAALLNDFLR